MTEANKEKKEKRKRKVVSAAWRRDIAAFGVRFIKYLRDNEKLKTVSKSQLKITYSEFRATFERNAIPKKSGFSNVMYALHFSLRVIRCYSGYVYFRGTTDYNESYKQSRRQSSLNKEINRMLQKSKGRDSLLASDLMQIRCEPVQFEESPGHYTCDNKNTSFDIFVKNISSQVIVLETCTLYRSTPSIILSDEYGCTGMLEPGHKKLDSPEKLKFQPGNEYTINVKFNVPSNQVGCYAGEVFFKFVPDNGQEFLMLRYVRCNKSDEVTKMLQPTSSYAPPVIPRLAEAEKIDLGEPLESLGSNKLKYERPLPAASVPTDVAIAESKFAFGERAPKSKLKELLQAELTENNYAAKFNLLLHLEEIQAKKDIASYDMHAAFTKEGKKFSLKVPGLAEKRPSVLKGDNIHVRKLDKNDNPCNDWLYKGVVHEVRLNDVVLSFGPWFHKVYMKGMKFYVRFTYNRLPDKLQHRAVSCLKFAQPEKVADYRKILFPVASDIPEESTADHKLKCYNKNIGSNIQQSLAIESIVFGTSKVPYIVYGPPGTGKTVTLVEAIKQLVNTKKSKILVCAPSNSACDLLTERIITNEGAVNSKQVFRMHALSRPWLDVPEKIRACSNRDAVDYYYPSSEEILKYNVVSTTLITAGRLASALLPMNHFDYVFIDEAGQAVEPESVVAVESVLGSNGRLVLAGDPHQLGPLLRNNIAISHGLAVSVLERLMMRDIYQPSEKDQTYDHRVITKLLNNYRSHKDIIQVPNECFYENELKECADVMLRKSLCDWEHLPKQNFPVIFHGVNGRDQREGNSPSFFNPEEASIVNSYVKKIMETKKNRVEPKDIGIIAPYRKQVEKIRKVLEKQNNPALRNIKVGSTEEFQGQERKVIIISTVRSDPEHIGHDIKHQLGFLTNPKRMNVSLTRAKCLLILIGNPNMLCLDHYWKKFLEFCIDNGGYTGLAFEMPQEPMDEDAVVEIGGDGDGLAVQLKRLEIKEEIKIEGSIEISAVQGEIHPPSRYAEH